MVYTRAQNSSSLSAAAAALLSFRNHLSFTRYSLAQPVAAESLAPTPVATPATGPSQRQFWSQWTTWYHAFISEVTDEYPSLPISERRSQATSRWVSYTAKQLRCSESQVRAWLRTANQKNLAAAYA